MSNMVTSRPTEEQEFRQDINGLRAWAVILVILYHFGWKRFSGGYVGVDVFFVISGFLMTRIIARGLETGRFSVTAFYHARARRILPALVVLCASLLVLGWLFLTPIDYQMLGQHVIQSVLFLSNIQFWREAGYFDVASHEKWLLHTWSLSVEWQFYLLFPLLLMVAWHYRPTRSSIRAAVGLGFMASLLVLLTAPPDGRNAAFFLLPHRAWELLAGGLVYLYAGRIGGGIARLLELVGFALILGAANWLESRTPWPGWRTLIPVAGAALILIAARERSVWTTNPLARWVGNCSYSLYLWHWPIYVGLVYLERESDIVALGVALALTIAVAGWSHRFVETGFRLQLARSVPRTSMAILAIAMLSVMGVSRAIDMKEGAPWRIPPHMRSITDDLMMPLPTNGWCFHSVDTMESLEVGDAGLQCKLGDSDGEVRGLLFGDSYAGHYSPFWGDIASKSAVELNAVATNWCYPSLTREFSGPLDSRAFDQCLINRTHFRDRVGDYDFVILAGSWRSIHAQGLLGNL